MKIKIIVTLMFILRFFSIVIAQNPDVSTSVLNILEEIKPGGVRQWIHIKGENIENPILLFLHGGPGFTHMPFSHYDSKELEKHFIVVNWDQRYAGKSYSEDFDPETLNIKQHLSDTYELIQLLRKRFSKDKIFLSGHSWGSILGLYTTYKHPELIYAYIGIGQVINSLEGETLSYNYAMGKAIEAGDEESIGMLERLEKPPYKEGFESVLIQRYILGKYKGALYNINYSDMNKIRMSSPYYSESDQKNFMNAFYRIGTIMWKEVMKVNFFEEISELKVPVYFFIGKHDYQTPFELVEKFYSEIKAPYKEIIWFDKSAHMLNIEEPQKFQNNMLRILKKTKQ